MTSVVVCGYSGLDHVIELDGAPSADRTTIIRARPAQSWGRPGGSPAYVARALAAEGVADTAIVSWIGADALGETFRAALRRDGLGVEGVEARPGRTPISILAYEPGGACFCLYDPGVAFETDLSAAQRAIVARADWLCLTIGPPLATRTALANARADARVVWAVKNDPRSAPPDLVALIAARADVVSHSRGEAPFVNAALADAPRRERLVVETLGAQGARATWRGQSLGAQAAEVAAPNPTGAGDTFVGGLIAGLVDQPHDPAAALQRATAAARRMLLLRGAGASPNSSTHERTG